MWPHWASGAEAGSRLVRVRGEELLLQVDGLITSRGAIAIEEAGRGVGPLGRMQYILVRI